jgi:uncharacterized protein (TIGR03435 family)
LPYVLFAYKLRLTDEQTRIALAQVPKWFNTDLFEIEARAEGNLTKDQMRLMMQSLLAARFKLAVHFDMRETAVLELTLVNPGKRGPKLRPHSEGPPCPAASVASGSVPQVGEVFPPICGNASWFKADGVALMASRDSTPALLAESIQSWGILSGETDKPVVDKTGLSGTFDYTIEWNGRLPGPRPSGVDALPPDPTGTTFLQAVREQLG